LQEWYPEPPRVIFLSNNEHGKLHWSQAETAKRYLDRYGKGKDGNFKRKTVADGFVERYRVLQEGMREGLTNPAWKKNAVFIAYGDYGPAHFGRWGGTDPGIAISYVEPAAGLQHSETIHGLPAARAWFCVPVNSARNASTPVA
jgi:hypothetical protein